MVATYVFLEIESIAVKKQRWGTEIVFKMIAKSFSMLPSKLKVKAKRFRRGSQRSFNWMIEGFKKSEAKHFCGWICWQAVLGLGAAGFEKAVCVPCVSISKSRRIHYSFRVSGAHIGTQP